MRTVCLQVIICLEIVVLVRAAFSVILRFDPDSGLCLDGRIKKDIWLWSALGGAQIAVLLHRWGTAGQLFCGILAAYLITASITDLQICQVYDFLSVITAAAGIGMLLLLEKRDWGPALAVFLFLQMFLFKRMYGRADSYAFCVCAIFESMFRPGLLTYLLHMGAAFLALGAVQLWKKNVNRQGNLKKPVPFLPYIAATVWLFLW